MSRRYPTWIAVPMLLAIAGSPGCTRHKSARKPVQMVSMPPPAEAPHAQSSVPVGGAHSYDADDLMSCEADVPNLLRAYATADTLTLIGLAPGQTTLRLRLSSGDEFYLDMDVTKDPIDYRVLAVGEQLALPLEGVKEVKPVSQCVTATKNADGTQLFVLGQQPCTVVVGLLMNDGSTKTTEVLVVGGVRVL